MQVDRRRTQLKDEFAAADLDQMQVARNYTDWIADQIRPHCGRRILEVGAGIGNITRRLVTHAEHVCALEPNPACYAKLELALERRPNFECRPWRIEDCDPEFVASRRIDTIVCVNVLEHLEDDLAVLSRFRSMLDHPRGRLVLVVPAVPAAYGSIDVALGHFRRYTRRGLEDLLHRAEFSIATLRYSNFPGLLGWVFNARIARRVKQSDAQILLFDRLVVPWSARLERLVSPPIGLSLVAAAYCPAR